MRLFLGLPAEESRNCIIRTPIIVAGWISVELTEASYR